jgi:hypothetical protein
MGPSHNVPPEEFETSWSIDPQATADPDFQSTHEWLVPDRQDTEQALIQDAGREFADKTSAKTTDPASYYLRELRTIPLLGRKDEVRLAQKIEEGEAKIIAGALCSLLPVRYTLDLEKKLAAGILNIRDVIETRETSRADPRLVKKKLRRRFGTQVRKLQSMASRYETAARQSTKRMPKVHRELFDKKPNRLKTGMSATLASLRLSRGQIQRIIEGHQRMHKSLERAAQENRGPARKVAIRTIHSAVGPPWRKLLPRWRCLWTK